MRWKLLNEGLSCAPECSTDDVNDRDMWMKSERKPLYESSGVYASPHKLSGLQDHGDFSTNLPLRVALLGFKHHVVVGAESEMTALTLECRQISAIETLRTTGPFQVKPDSKSNARTKLGTGLSELADAPVTGLSASHVTLRWNRWEGRIGVSVDSLEAVHQRSIPVNHPNGTKNLLWHRDRHCIADDLDQFTIRVRLTHQDSGVTTPTQSEPFSIVKNRVGISRTLNVEVHVTLEKCSDPPV